MKPVVFIVMTGVGATAMTDIWAVIRRLLLGVPPPDYSMVGRWFGHMPSGRFRHDSMVAASKVDGEGLIGWSAHYAIGIVYAAILIGLWPGWMQRPTLFPALLVGIATVFAPFLLMQPGMGAGIAAGRTPRPNTARMHSLIMHTVFGLGLYATGRLISIVSPSL